MGNAPRVGTESDWRRRSLIRQARPATPTGRDVSRASEFKRCDGDWRLARRYSAGLGGARRRLEGGLSPWREFGGRCEERLRFLFREECEAGPNQAEIKFALGDKLVLAFTFSVFGLLDNLAHAARMLAVKGHADRFGEAGVSRIIHDHSRPGHRLQKRPMQPQRED